MELYKDLPKDTFKFKFKETGDITQITYEGDFVVRVPTLDESAEIEKLMAFCVDGLDSIAVTAREYFWATAYLSVVLRESPEWWTESDKGKHLRDRNILYKLYDQAKKLETAWYAEVMPVAEEKKPGGGEGD